MREIQYETTNESDSRALKSFLLTCYANIALTNMKLNKFPVAIDACNEMLHIEPHDAKALYLRSQARLLPKSSSLAEQEQGLKDLSLANKNDTKNPLIRCGWVVFLKKTAIIS